MSRIALFCVVLLGFLTACGDQGSPLKLGPQVVGPAGGQVYSQDGNAYVVIPAGAIGPGESMEIAVTKVDEAPPEAFGESLSSSYKFTPSGTRFNSKVRVFTRYDRVVPDGVNEDELGLVLKSGLTGEWEAMAEVVVNPGTGFISGETSHFSTLSLVATTGVAPGFRWPMPSAHYVTQAYGHYEDAGFPKKHHAGIDISPGGAPGEDVVSIYAGEVVSICNDFPKEGDHGDHLTCSPAFGLRVIIKLDYVKGGLFKEPVYALYGHLSKVDENLKVGAHIPAGTKVGEHGGSGSGSMTGVDVHLHLEIRNFEDDCSDTPSQLGCGYRNEYPSDLGEHRRYYDPMEFFFHHADIKDTVVRVTAEGSGTPLRPAPLYSFLGGAGFRTGGAVTGELYRVVGGVGKTTNPACLGWYLVRPMPGTQMTREVLGEMYFTTNADRSHPNSAVREAWICEATEKYGRNVEVVSGAAAGVLTASPADNWLISGTAGGPFSPTSRTYTLNNSGDTALSWRASENASWLSLSGASSGSLAPGATANVTATLVTSGAQGANSLSPGTYTEAIVFTNTTSGTDIPRSARLTVEVADTPGEAAWQVSPGSLSFSGVVGASAPAPQSFTVRNAGSASGSFTISNTPSWVSTISPSSGIVPAGGATSVTVTPRACSSTQSINQEIQVGDGRSVTYVQLALNCSFAPEGVLAVSPTSTWSISGTEGGPFSPTSRTYTLNNSGDATLSWQASESASWLSISGSSSGSLAPGATTSVTVTLTTSGTQGANRLSPGTYSDDIVFTNTTAGTNTRRSARITVETGVPTPLPRTELLSNRSFDGHANWSVIGDAWVWNGGTESSYRTAPGYAALGVDWDGYAKNGAVGFITQQVQVPAGATRAEFSLYYSMTTNDSSGDNFPLVVTAGSCSVSNPTVLGGFTLAPADARATYGRVTSATFNVTGSASGAVCVRLGGGTDASLTTVLRIDDVSLVVWGE